MRHQQFLLCSDEFNVACHVALIRLFDHKENKSRSIEDSKNCFVFKQDNI